MTDASASELAPIDIQPVTVDALIRGLPRSKRGGYVEEIVDEHLKDFASQINLLVGEYNTLLAEYKDAKNAADASPTHSAFQETEEENAERIAALYRDAQRNAREFVEDARERGTNIVNRAESEAQELRTNAHEETEALRATVQAEVESTRSALEAQVTSTQNALANEVETTRAALQVEVSTARERLEAENAQLNAVRDRLTAETQEIFNRLRAFHETQLSTLDDYQASVRFDAPEEFDSAEEDDVVTEDVEPATETDTDGDVAADDDAANETAETETAEVDADEVREPVTTDEVADAGSEPEVFTPDEPQEAPEASVNAETTDEDDLDVTETGGEDTEDGDDNGGRKRRWRR